MYLLSLQRVPNLKSGTPINFLLNKAALEIRRRQERENHGSRQIVEVIFDVIRNQAKRNVAFRWRDRLKTKETFLRSFILFLNTSGLLRIGWKNIPKVYHTFSREPKRDVWYCN